MAATDAQVIAAAARWNDENLYLRDFVTKNRTPIVVKIIKGQHGSVGVPTLSNPTLNSTVLLISTGKKRKVIAQSVKFKENQRVVSVGSRIAIPETYTGWFELLSEEGRSIKCIDSVVELSRKKSDHFQYLVRDSIRCLIGLETSNGSIIAEGSKILNAGEVIIPSGEIQLPLMKIRHLKCEDSNGGLVLLSLDQKGRFSPIIRDDDVSGVRLMSNLIDKKMPLPVRLVHGPSLKGLKNTNQFAPEMKLLQIYEEETIFALPLQKEPMHLTKVPLSATLKLIKAKNNDSLQAMPEFQRLLDKSNKLINETGDDIQIFDCVKKSSSSISLFRRSSSSDNVHQKSFLHHKTPNRVKLNENLKEYDEIDLIYDYVRGFAPLPKNLRQSYSESNQLTSEQNNCNSPPEPPPIETIPTKKLQPEKRNSRQTAVRSLSHNQTDNLLSPSTKLYLKSGNSNRLRYFRPKNSPPLKEQMSSPSISPPILVKIGSPLFGLQYKSLNNLQQAMELDGTLNSSNSGGRFSLESADGFIKQPDKCSRRLSRPKSLTNLVWEIREAPVIVEKPKLLTYKKLSSKFFFGGHKHAGTLYL